MWCNSGKSSNSFVSPYGNVSAIKPNIVSGGGGGGWGKGSWLHSMTLLLTIMSKWMYYNLIAKVCGVPSIFGNDQSPN